MRVIYYESQSDGMGGYEWVMVGDEAFNTTTGNDCTGGSLPAGTPAHGYAELD